MTDNWDKSRGAWLRKLDSVNTLLQQLKAAGRHNREMEVLLTKRDFLRVERDVQRQLKKLRDNEFHIAIVGLEKSGKSTFLNAWLKSDLLPNADTRCTYTTTELRSTMSDDEQRVVVKFLSREAFQRTISEYEKLAAGTGTDAENAREDLKEIEKNRAQIEANIGKADEVIYYQNLEEIRDTLEHYIAYPPAARSVESVTLYSRLLLNRGGLVFHDVPGYDSPTQLHKELAREELARADVIIFVTNIAANTSITGPQLQMLDVADKEDPTITASDKLFVFLNKIDMLGGPDALANRTRNAIEQWADRYEKCIPERIIPGSAGAYLYRTATNLQESASRELASSNEDLARQEPPFGDGIQYLQDKIKEYIQTDRIRVLEKRCQTLLKESQDMANSLLTWLNDHYPATPEEIDRQQQSLQAVQLGKWIDHTWNRFLDDLDDFWANNISQVSEDSPEDGVRPHENFNKLNEKFTEIVQRIQDQYFLSEEDIRAQYRRNISDSALQPSRTNLQLRDRLIKERIEPGLEDIPDDLAGALLEIIAEVQEFAIKHFYDIKELEPHLIPLQDTERYEQQVGYGLATLFLRYARPAITVFLSQPRGLPDRENVLNAHQKEILLLEMYYEGDDDRAELAHYLKTGSWERPEPETPAPPTSIPTDATPLTLTAFDVLLKAQQKITPQTKVADSEEEVAQEIHADSEAFIYYLENSVYQAASLFEFCRQELERVRRHLKSPEMKEIIRTKLTQAYFNRANYPRVREYFGEQSFDTEQIRRMVQHREQIREALQAIN